MGPLIAIAGPTASGKSSLALLLAKRLATSVVSVDSVQVYRGFDIGTAKLAQSEWAGVTHHMIDCADPLEALNAGEFVRHVDELLGTYGESPALFCVGTSMYFSALVRGLVSIPSAPSSIKTRLQELPVEELYARLCSIDATRAKELHPRDRARISRALEAFEATGLPMGEALAIHRNSPDRYAFLCLVLVWPREILYQRINQRVAAMLRAGLLEEVRSLIAKYGLSAPGLKSLGYAQVVDFLDGRIESSQLEEEIARETRRYAKRQTTYWRNEPEKRKWLCRPLPEESALVIDEAKGHARAANKACRVFDWGRDELFKQVEQRLRAPIDRTEVWYISAQGLV